MTVSNLFNLSHYVSNNDLNSAKWCKFADSRIGKIHLSISDAYTDLQFIGVEVTQGMEYLKSVVFSAWNNLDTQFMQEYPNF